MFLFWGCGCVQVKHDLMLEADGSGLLDMRFAVDETVMGGWKGLEAGRGEAADLLPPGLEFDPDAIQEDFARYRPLGIRVLHSEMSRQDGWRHFRLLLRFENMEALNQTALYAQRSWSLRKNPAGDYLLQQRPGPSGPLGPPGLNWSDPAVDAELRKQLQGFRATLSVSVPGDILQTNGDRHEGRRATWIYAGSPAGGMETAQDAVQEIVFAGGGLSLPEFGRQQVQLSVKRP